MRAMNLKAFLVAVTLGATVLMLHVVWFESEGTGVFGLVGGLYEGPGIFFSGEAVALLMLLLVAWGCGAAALVAWNTDDRRVPKTALACVGAGLLSFALVHPALTPAAFTVFIGASVGDLNPFWWRRTDLWTWIAGSVIHLGFTFLLLSLLRTPRSPDPEREPLTNGRKALFVGVASWCAFIGGLVAVGFSSGLLRGRSSWP